MALLVLFFLFTQILGQIIPPNCPSDKIGDGWVLIRRTASTLNPSWHPAADDLALTETYDIGSSLPNCVTDEVCAVETNAQFSKNASSELATYNQLLFASGDCTFWLMVNKTVIDFISAQSFSQGNFEAVRSSEPDNECSASTFSPHGYTQALVPGLPIICEVSECLGAPPEVRFYYAENSVTNNIDTVANLNGMNVWVREFSTTFNLDTCAPTASPTPGPTDSPTPTPSDAPTLSPTPAPSISPTPSPTPAPSDAPSMSPTPAPSLSPTPAPSNSPTPSPTPAPSDSPTLSPTPSPSLSPTPAPSNSPTPSPTPAPTDSPTLAPSISPTPIPSNSPTPSPTPAPSDSPTLSPTLAPSISPTPVPTDSPTPAPSLSPTPLPSLSPTPAPSVSPTLAPSLNPTPAPSNSPTPSPSPGPTDSPTSAPSNLPTPSPSPAPTDSPTSAPSISPTPLPTKFPSKTPIKEPTLAPTQTNPILFNNYIDGTKWAWSQWAVLGGILLIICLIILVCFLWYRHHKKVREHEEQLKKTQEKELEKQQNEQDFNEALNSGAGLNSINSISKENNKTTDGDNEFDTGIDVGVTTPEDDSKVVELVTKGGDAVPENKNDDNSTNNDNNNEIKHVLVTPDGNDDNIPAPKPPKASDDTNAIN